MASNRVLLVGASGLIGRRLMSALGPRAIGTRFSSSSLSQFIPYDLAEGDPEALLDKAGEGITHSVILGARVNVDECARDPEGTARVNVEGVWALAKVAIERGITPVYVSSDAVYGNSAGPHREDDSLNPIMVYGQQKAEVESRLAASGAPYLALRLAKILDPDLSTSGVLGPWLRALKDGSPIRCAVDQRFTPLGVCDVASATIDLMEGRAVGIFNVGGAEPLDRLHLLRLLISAYEERVGQALCSKVETCRFSDLGLREPRPVDCVLSIEKLRMAIGYSPRPLGELCRDAVAAFTAR